jgi:hypothetical protein
MPKEYVLKPDVGNLLRAAEGLLAAGYTNLGHREITGFKAWYQELDPRGTYGLTIGIQEDNMEFYGMGANRVPDYTSVQAYLTDHPVKGYNDE